MVIRRQTVTRLLVALSILSLWTNMPGPQKKRWGAAQGMPLVVPNLFRFHVLPVLPLSWKASNTALRR